MAQDSSHAAGSSAIQVIVYWAIVAVPLGWGVYKTVDKSKALFQGTNVNPTASSVPAAMGTSAPPPAVVSGATPTPTAAPDATAMPTPEASPFSTAQPSATVGPVTTPVPPAN